MKSIKSSRLCVMFGILLEIHINAKLIISIAANKCSVPLIKSIKWLIDSLVPVHPAGRWWWFYKFIHYDKPLEMNHRVFEVLTYNTRNNKITKQENKQTNRNITDNKVIRTKQQAQFNWHTTTTTICTQLDVVGWRWVPSNQTEKTFSHHQLCIILLIFIFNVHTVCDVVFLSTVYVFDFRAAAHQQLLL